MAENSENEIVHFPVKFRAIHVKTNKIYNVISTGIIETTNARDGSLVYLYYNPLEPTKIYCRDAVEFGQKFKVLTGK